MVHNAALPDGGEMLTVTKAPKKQRKQTTAATMVFIYCLRDPRTKEIRYVGQTRHFHARRLQHLNGADPTTREWVEALRGEGQIPLMEDLKYVPVDEANEEERVIIADLLLQGSDLLNKLTYAKQSNKVVVALRYDTWKFLRDVAAKRAVRKKGRLSVAAVLEDLIEKHKAELEAT